MGYCAILVDSLRCGELRACPQWAQRGDNDHSAWSRSDKKLRTEAGRVASASDPAHGRGVRVQDQPGPRSVTFFENKTRKLVDSQHGYKSIHYLRLLGFSLCETVFLMQSWTAELVGASVGRSLINTHGVQSPAHENNRVLIFKSPQACG